MRPAVNNLFQFFESERFENKQFDLLKINRDLYDMLQIDDTDENSSKTTTVKALRAPLIAMKSKIQQSMDNLSMWGTAYERRSKIVGESTLSNANSPLNRKTLHFESNFMDSHISKNLFAKPVDSDSRKID